MTTRASPGVRAHPRPRARELTVRGWQYLVVSVMGALVLAGALGGAALLKRTVAASRELSENILPAQGAAYQLQTALRDQETAARGYVLAADPQFLAPYYDGQRDEQAAAAEIRTRVGYRRDLIADVDSIEQAAAAWRSDYAQPLIAAVRPGTPSTISTSTADRGKAEFDHLRMLFDTQAQHLTVARADANRQLERIRRWRDGVLAGIVVVFFATTALLAFLTRNAVTRPLASLASACRRITEGHFEERITPRGPRDIRAMAADVENMRQRIVDELSAAHSARARLAAQAQELDEQAADLRRSNAELEQFAYVASHDLQEPLRKVASFCQLLERRYGDQLDERGMEYIGFAVDGAKRTQVLIDDLLTVSRVGRLNATRSVFGLDGTLEAAIANLTAGIEESSAQIRCTGSLPRIVGDPTLLTMLWQNLIGNAIKFRQDGVAPRITVDGRPAGGDLDDQWVFSVADNGIGIAREFADKVFVIFQRLHARDAYPGTGIGLSLCKKIVEQHGGTIWVDTTYSGGTRLCFTLPCAGDHNTVGVLQESPP